MNIAPILVVTHTPNSYQSPFTGWNESSWIRSKSIREDEIFGLPFSPDLVPFAAHHLISDDSNLWQAWLESFTSVCC